MTVLVAHIAEHAKQCDLLASLAFGSQNSSLGRQDDAESAQPFGLTVQPFGACLRKIVERFEDDRARRTEPRAMISSARVPESKEDR